MQLPLFDKVSRKPAAWVIGVAAVGLVGTAATVPLAMRNAASQAPASDLTIPAQAKTVTVRVTASGDVIALRTVNLNPKTQGILEQRLVKQGDRVSQGQLIARMENRNLKADLAQAQANLEQMQANLSLLQAGTRPEVINQAAAGVNQSAAQVSEAQAGITKAEAQLAQSNARLQKAKADFDRNTSLYNQGAIAKSQLDIARQDYEVALAQKASDEKGIAQAQASLSNAQAGLSNSQGKLAEQQNGPRSQEIAQAAAQVKAAQAKVQAIQTQIEDTYIRAPFDGIITQTGAEEGAFVAPTSFSSNTGSATYIATLASDLEIKAKVSPVDISQIRVGQEVEVRTNAYPDKVFKGTVRLISPQAKPETDNPGSPIFFEVRVKLVTGKEFLRAGMTTDLSFLGQKLQAAVMVPSVSIVTNQGQTGVLVVGENNKPKFQPVTIGSQVGNETQILNGLQPNDRIFKQLPEGQKLDDILKNTTKR